MVLVSDNLYQFPDTLLRNAQLLGKLLIRNHIRDKIRIGMDDIAGIEDSRAVCLCGI